jgi:glucose-1-phosphate thymidylyltransferase
MKIRKAILTGGGRATRLRPITHTMNKHLIPLANKAMIFYAIEKAVEAGVEEIYININPEETQLQKYIGDGGHWGVKIEFFVQEGGPQGIAHVVKCAEKFIGEEPFMFFLSDNILLGSLVDMFKEFEEKNLDCMLALSKVADPERFGVPVFNKDKTAIVDVLEKPQQPPNDFAVTGMYLYKSTSFFKAFDHIKKSARGEYEISDIHSYFLKNGYTVGWREITGWWKDTGKPEDLIIANQLLLDKMPASSFVITPKVDSSVVEGNVHIGGGTSIGKNVKLIGPVLIAENSTLENCVIGPHVTVGTGCVIKNATVTNSIVFSGTTIDCPIKVTQSIVGANAKVTSGTVEGYHRLILGDHTLIQV